MDTAREALIAFVASLNSTQLGLLSTVLVQWEGDENNMCEIAGEYVDLAQKLHGSLTAYRAEVNLEAMPNIEEIDSSLVVQP